MINAVENIDYQLVFLGDTSFGENYQVKIAKKGGVNILDSNGYDYCLEKVARLISNADRIIANLETPLTNIARSPFSGLKKYIHWSDRQMTPETLVKYGIDSVSLANNHILDYGIEGFEDTLHALQEYRINGFGAGVSFEEASRPLSFEVCSKKSVLVVAGLVSDPNHINRYINEWSEKSIVQQIKSIRKRNKNAFIIAYPHWGGNYMWKTEEQTTLGHEMINTGADIVIGHGAHALQEIEFYHGKWIIYSLGNFVFNSPGRYKTKNYINVSLIARLRFCDPDKRTITIKLYPILSDNSLTNYQPRPLTYAETQNMATTLDAKCGLFHAYQTKVAIELDELGMFLYLK